jgi:flavin-dependent dehydrogenase
VVTAPTARGKGDRCDVVVVGGGPAGAATARDLARRGRSVVLVGRPDRGRPRLGETVPPIVVQHLARLGLWETFLAAEHAEAPGTVVRWGSARPYENDFLVDPNGPGWHLDRARFDDMLRDAAVSAGAELVVSPGFAQCRDGADGWVVRTAGPSGRTVRARWLVDASGRAARVARSQGVERRTRDGLVGLARYYAAPPDLDPRTFVESCEAGWWYAAGLPDGRAVVVLFTDADLLPARPRRASTWEHLLAGTRLIRDRTAGCRTPSALHAAPSSSTVLARGAGASWAAVGDAVQAWDPLSGQGIIKALSSASRAAEAMAGDGDREAALADYDRDAQRQYRAYLTARTAYYGRERRWRHSPFWRRRAG